MCGCTRRHVRARASRGNGHVRPRAGCGGDDKHAVVACAGSSVAHAGMCGHVRGASPVMCGHVRSCVRSCAALVPDRCMQLWRVRSCAGARGVLAGSCAALGSDRRAAVACTVMCGNVRPCARAGMDARGVLPQSCAEHAATPGERGRARTGPGIQT